MKNLTKLVFVVALMSSSLGFAAKDTTMQINFVDNTAVTGYPAVESNQQIILGSIIERNGGQSLMSPSVSQAPIYPGFARATGNYEPCQQDQQGYLSLDPTHYTGDLITITMQYGQNYLLECTCTGSACSFGTL